MNIKLINIAEILKTQFAFAINKEEAEDYILKNLSNIQDETLVVFDITTATTDHYFCQAFGKLFFDSFVENSKIDVLFKVHDYDIPSLLKGLLKFKNISHTEKDIDIVSFFIKQDFSIKLMDGESKVIQFISNLDEDPKRVLDFINEQKIIKAEAIYENHICPIKKVGYVLKSLQEKRFIYLIDSEEYESIYNFLKN